MGACQKRNQTEKEKIVGVSITVAAATEGNTDVDEHTASVTVGIAAATRKSCCLNCQIADAVATLAAATADVAVRSEAFAYVMVECDGATERIVVAVVTVTVARVDPCSFL